jgi:6-pyruvoyl-tetrahydropterin synthase
MLQLFVDELTVIDCSYLHPQHGIIGESFIVDVALAGSLDSQSMIMDFGKVKKRLKALIDSSADHALLVPRHSPHLQQFTLNDEDGASQLLWRDAQGREWEHRSPQSALFMVDADAVSIASLQDALVALLMKEMPETVQHLQLTLRHEALPEGLYYHYSHGLKKHDGNCQRIAHGHRSKLEIWRDGELALPEMRNICARWAQAYLVTQEDILQQSDAEIISGYGAPQGRFWLRAPREACDILPCDSTVECIAQHLADQLKAQAPASHWRVKAYEGVRKGALA